MMCSFEKWNILNLSKLDTKYWIRQGINIFELCIDLSAIKIVVDINCIKKILGKDENQRRYIQINSSLLK